MAGPATAGDVDPGALAVEQLRWLETADADDDFQRDIDAGFVRFVGVSGFSVLTPPVSAIRYAMCYEPHTKVRIIDGGGCLVWGDEHSRLREIAYDYAEAYNTLLLDYLEDNGRSDCTNSIDWDGAWEAVADYLHMDRRRDRGTFSMGSAELHVSLNRFKLHVKTAQDICGLLRSHGFDRTMSVVITPRKPISTDAERDQLYRFECPVGDVPSN